MHIIAFENKPTSKAGGQELNLLEICQEMAFRGHEVSLVYPEPGDLLDKYAKFSAHLIQVDRYQLAKKTLPNVARFFAGMNTDLKKIRTTADSVLFCNDLCPTFFASRLAKKRDVPMVQYLQIPGKPFKRKWRPGLSNADRIITVSEANKATWVENCDIAADKIKVVYNGPNLDTFSPCADIAPLRAELGLSPEDFVCLYIGRLNPVKGIEVLLQAFAKLVKSVPQGKLLIAGEPKLEPGMDSPQGRVDYKNHLMALVRSLEIEANVRFLGHFSDTALLYRVSDVTAVPSIWPDPCPRVVLESFACGTPVVGSRMGGIPEQFTATFDDWLCLPNDDDSLRQTLEQLVGWRQTNPALAQHCRNHILKHFTPAKMMDEIEHILGETIAAHRGQGEVVRREPIAAGNVSVP